MRLFLLGLITLFTLLTLWITIANSVQMDNIEDLVLDMYNKDCLYCTRNGLSESVDG